MYFLTNRASIFYEHYYSTRTKKALPWFYPDSPTHVVDIKEQIRIISGLYT